MKTEATSAILSFLSCTLCPMGIPVPIATAMPLLLLAEHGRVEMCAIGEGNYNEGFESQLKKQ